SASSPSTRRSSDSRIERPSSKSRRSPASTFSRTRSRRLRSPTATSLAPPIDDDVGQCLELRLVSEETPRPSSVVEGHLAGSAERARLGHADERSFDRTAREGLAHDLVLARGEDQRQRGPPLAQVRAGNLPGLDRVADAIEDVVGDLKRDSEREPEGPEPC